MGGRDELLASREAEALGFVARGGHEDEEDDSRREERV